jgi:hypothetical protein
MTDKGFRRRKLLYVAIPGASASGIVLLLWQTIKYLNLHENGVIIVACCFLTGARFKKQPVFNCKVRAGAVIPQ